MDADESDEDVSNCIENNSDGEENSSEEDSEEGSDDDSEENDDGTTDALSEEEDEDDGETVSDDDDGGEAASIAAGDEVRSVDSDGEETFDKKDITDLGDPDMSCAICLNEFVGQDLGSPENCSHTFCLECIVEWSKNINTCPIDRIEFHLIYVKQEINGDVIKKLKVKVKREVEEYVEEVTLCEVCRLGDREDRLLLCDSCDSGYHCECLDPPLETIPIEEWFCPPCTQVLNQRASSSQASHSRLIARTSASEIVRSRIQHHRTANSGDSGSETTQQPPRGVSSPARAPRKRKVTRRKTRRKTTRKSSKSKKTQARTKATSAGKSKTKKGSSKTSTKRKRKTKRRKTSKKKKKSKKSWLASMKLVAPSVKKRIADHLGLCKPPPGHTMPYVKKPGGQHSVVEQLPSLNVFGCRDQLFDFNESYTDDDDVDNPKPSTSKQRIQAISSRCSIAVASTSGINILDNILEKQTDLLRNTKNITIGKDGSLSVNEKNSSVKVKCGITSLKNELKDDALAVEQKTTASLSSLVYVKAEKNAIAIDSSSADTKKIMSEDSPSSVSALFYNSVKKEKACSHSRVRFNDTETVSRLENSGACEALQKIPVKEEYNLHHSRQGKEDISPAKASVCVKKEKDNDFPLMDIRSANTELQAMEISFDISWDGETKEHNVNGKESHQSYKNGITSPLLFNLHKQHFHTVADSPDISTNKPSLSSNIDSYNSAKDMQSSDNHSQQKSAASLCAKTNDTSSSLFDKAENDRKRHLPFLSNSLQRPFKIPKLVKRTGKSLESEAKLLTPVNTNDHANIKVPTKSENTDKNLSSKKLLSMTKASICDSELKIGHQKHTFDDHTDLGETMAVEVHVDQSNISEDANNKLLQVAKQEKGNESYKNHKKSDVNCKSSLNVMPTLSGLENSRSSGSRYSSKSTGNNLQKVVSHNSRSGLNSDSIKLDRKTRDDDVSSSSKGVKSNEHKHLLNASEMRISKPAQKSPVQNTELPVSSKIANKVPSKQKLKEDIINEIKKHLKDFYVTDLITKGEYKEIMRRSVPKVFQNCGNSIDSAKIRKLVISYVQVISNSRADSS